MHSLDRYAQLKKSQPHKQHIWFLPTQNPTQKKPKELFFCQRFKEQKNELRNIKQ
jgi:hypothetical protein